MTAKVSKKQGARSQVKQESVRSVWGAYFRRRSEAEKLRRSQPKKKK